MHIHLLGICGKFVSGLAIIAKQMGFEVSGSDQNIIPAIAEPLQQLGIPITQGYEADVLPTHLDYVIVGNALSRGKPVIEHILNEQIPFYSGPEWLSRHVLFNKWVLAVSGTHGKTTTTSMVAWILEKNGLEPGFLIGGNPANFDFSARYTQSDYFAIEADEYDTAFFDKRSKFIHYRPKTLIINNLEFDHADIFSNLDDIKKQFSQLLRIVPNQGLIIAPKRDLNVQSLLGSCWTPITTFDEDEADWCANKLQLDGSQFEVFHQEQNGGLIDWSLIGSHNINNALAAIAAANHIGIDPMDSVSALNHFKGVKRRLELRGVVQDIHVYDDFAHHPTAISATLSALRNRVGSERIFAVLEFGSNTMRQDHHKNTIAWSLANADHVILLKPTSSNWDFEELLAQFEQPVELFDQVDDIVNYLSNRCKSGDHVLCMSNMLFGDIHQKLLASLQTKAIVNQCKMNLLP